jgi:hypothetical protein
MARNNRESRRGFLRQIGVAAGALAGGVVVAGQRTSAPRAIEKPPALATKSGGGDQLTKLFQEAKAKGLAGGKLDKSVGAMTKTLTPVDRRAAVGILEINGRAGKNRNLAPLIGAAIAGAATDLAKLGSAGQKACGDGCGSGCGAGCSIPAGIDLATAAAGGNCGDGCGAGCQQFNSSGLDCGGACDSASGFFCGGNCSGVFDRAFSFDPAGELVGKESFKANGATVAAALKNAATAYTKVFNAK